MSSSSALTVHWAYGFSKDVQNCVHSLSQRGRNAMFFVSSHSGVIYDFEHRTQMILQGHCNLISCCAVSRDKRWIVTADIGDDPILVVWDSMTGAPVKTIFTPHKLGVQSIDFSDDALFISTLSAVNENERVQELAIWAWTREVDSPLLKQNVLTSEVQNNIRFNPAKQSEIVTTGQSTVCFWNWEEFNLEGYVARVSKGDVGHFSGKFVSTVFLAGTGNAITCTSDGYTILWESQNSPEFTVSMVGKIMRSASKVLRLVECGINIMTTTENGYFVIACSDGAVRFYDLFLRLEAWYEDLSAGPITSFSMSVQNCPYAEGEAGAPGLKFWVPDFLVGTSNAFIVGVESGIFDEVRAEDRRGTLLVQGMAEDVSCVACHPNRSLFAIACYNGTMQIWDYDLKLLMNLREFNVKPTSSGSSNNQKGGSQSGNNSRIPENRQILRPQCLAFEPNGVFVAVGFTSGNVKFLHIDTFDDIASFAPTFDAIVNLKFSSTGQYLAGYDSSNHVLIFKRDTTISTGNESNSEHTESNDFLYIGRIHSHKSPVSGVEFGFRDGTEILFSIGEDRSCVEYDLEASSVTFGVICCQDRPFINKVESTARPTAIMWHPHIEGDIEERFIVANDEFKFKEFNADSKQCRRTTLAPMFGGPINCLLPIFPAYPGAPLLYAYSTASKVIGIGCLPLTGNPSEIMGLVAHPSTITSIAVSFDGRFMFSSGGQDLSVNMWSIDSSFWVSRKEENLSASINPMDPFLNLIEGGQGGELHNDMIDYFYYCQVRAQGENSMDSRELNGSIPLEEIPSLVRAVGFYPTEDEVNNMVNEVRYKSFMNTGELQNYIRLDDFIKLYLNHRPVLPLSNKQIQSSFETLRKCFNADAQGDGDLRWGDLKRILMSEGEIILPADLEACLSALMGAAAKHLDDDDDAFIDARLFADQVLGFEE